MTPDSSARQYSGSPWRLAGWGGVLALTLGAMFWLLAWYGKTVMDIVGIWQRSDTYAHGWLILPISAWLVWARRHEVAALRPEPNFWPLVLLGGLGAVWLAAELAGVSAAQHYSVALMLPLLGWIILGTQVAKALAFPLCFLLLAVPFGEFLLPTLMAYTADFTVWALRLSGIPVYREGLYFTLPSGQWSVIEACSGLRYLIASITLGVLYAYLTYRSLKRRLIFAALSVVVPVVANWLRAYMIVMIGHFSDMKLAVGIDHLIYGWLFFGVVMLLLFWIGSFWREDGTGAQTGGKAAVFVPGVSIPILKIGAAVMAVVAVAGVWPICAEYLENGGNSRWAGLEAPGAAGDWNPVPGALTGWRPHYLNARAQFNESYVSGGRKAGLYIGYYRQQRQGAKLVSSQNRIADGSAWIETDGRELAITPDFNVWQALLKRPNAPGRLLVWQWYWVNGEYTDSPYQAKLLQIQAKLQRKGDDAAAVVVYAPFDEKPEAAAETLRDFVKDMLPAIGRNLDAARQ